MARHYVAGRASAAATATLPAVSLYALTATGAAVREIGITNTTAVAFVATLARVTTTGTQGAGRTEGGYDPSVVTLCTAFDAHSVLPTLGTIVRQASIGAAIGAGMVWTFGDSGLRIPLAATNGIAIICATGTGQVFDFWIDWDE
jgi:hypothetical protein